jgi:ribosomal protein S18 acetylase RimI-like enzyme/Ser/Thr protein kinase RdoA (MazF antagonist)
VVEPVAAPKTLGVHPYLHVRDLTEADLPGVAWSGGSLHPRYVAEALHRRAATDEVEYLAVCGSTGAPIAIGGIDFAVSLGAGTLYQLAVMPTLQSRGIGTLLIDAAERRIRDRGLTRAELSVEIENTRAMALYQRLGYVGFGTELDSWETETPAGERQVHHAQCIRMRKDLQPWQSDRMDEVAPAWLSPWCSDALGSPVQDVLFAATSISEVYGVLLVDGRTATVKARLEPAERVASCLAIQRQLAVRGFPCPLPLTEASGHEAMTVHAEEYWPGGDVMRGDGPDVAARFAVLLAELVGMAVQIDATPPLPNPIWLQWDHSGAGTWPAYPRQPGRIVGAEPPAQVEDTARRVRARLRAVRLPLVIGHGDWESQNLRWRGGEPYVVHDWDSLCWLPEAAMAGAACGAFASVEQPTLAPLESSSAFLDFYEQARSRRFTREEREVAWAASLWLPAHNAYAEAMYALPPVATTQLSLQAEARLRRADA